MRASAWGTVVAGLAPLLAGGCTGYPPASGLSVLTNKEFAILIAVAEAVLPSDGDAPELSRAFDRLLIAHSDPVRRDFKAGLLLLEHGLAPLNATFGRFSRLGVAARRAMLGRGLESRWLFVRVAVGSLRRGVVFLHYNRDAAARSIGYDGPWVRPDEVIAP